MDFGLSDDQKLLYETVGNYLKEEVPIGRVRELEDEDTPYSREIWQKLAELGVAGILVAEEHGGSALSLLDAALVSQALGYGATPSPFLGTSVMSVLALSNVEGSSWTARSSTARR